MIDLSNDCRYREKKKVLGLHGDALPAMAMNTADGRVLTYDATEDFSELALESWIKSYLGEDVAAETKGVERGADSPRPPKPSDFGGEVVVGDAHADAFAEHVDNVTVLDTQNFQVIYTQHDGFCTSNDGIYTKHGGFCTKNDGLSGRRYEPAQGCVAHPASTRLEELPG